MAEYYNERSLLQGSTTPQFDVGSITRAGALTQQALGSVREKEIENAKLAREKQRFDREQLMNQRADTEYNREIGLRDTRKGMADEFLTNPYAAKFGADKETAELDKSVIDYVNKGGEINQDLAGRLQARYEQARPFREDAVNAITGNLVAAGEDPTKALATATALGSNLLGRADVQARADANRESQQKWYDAQAKANLEANKLNVDVGKANLTAQKDLIEARLKQFGGGGAAGGTAGMPGGDFTKVQEQVAAWDLGPIDRAQAIQFADKAKEMGYNANQVMAALKGSVDLDVGSVVSDKKVDGELFKGVLTKMAPGATVASGNIPQMNQTYTAESLMPQFAPRQVVGYDPKKFLEGSRDTLPEIVGAREKVLAGEPVSSGKGDTVADRNNNPGNLVTTKDNWLGKVGDDGKFVKFQTYELGARALAKNLYNGAVGQSIDSYMNKYAPKSENDTDAYIGNVAKALGKKPGDTITEVDVLPLMKVIAKQEGGKVDEDKLAEGYKMATLSKSITPAVQEATITKNERNTGIPVTSTTGTPLITTDANGRKLFNEDVNKARLEAFDKMPTGGNDVKQLFDRVDTTKNREQVKEFDSPAIQKSVVDSLNQSNGGPLDELLLKRRLMTDGLSEDEATKAITLAKTQTQAFKDTSTYNVLRRNYLTALREGTYQGKTAKEWEKEFFSTKY